MFHNKPRIAPAHVADLLAAAEAAARAIPPAFPLDATVAVNPVLGQTGEDLPTAAARLGRVAGASLTRPRMDLAAAIADGRIADDDLADALVASRSPLKPRDLALLKARAHVPAPARRALPTVADLAARETGTDWPGVIEKTVGLWAAGRFDRGQALWSPAPGEGAWDAWRAWAARDLTPELAGLRGFCAHVGAAPDTAERAILRTTDRLGLEGAAAETAFHRLLIDLGGWAQHARWLLWDAELRGGTDGTLIDLLAVRLLWDEALLAHVPAVAEAWADAVAAHARPVAPDADHVLDAILQDAAERAHQRRLAATLDGPRAAAADGPDRPALQAVFCIDVRSEPFRRALEAQAPGIETLGFAGFFGLPLSHRPHGTDEAEAHLPVLLTPSVETDAHADGAREEASRIRARAVRAWGRFRQAAVSSFAFVEAAGPAYAVKLLTDALGRVGKADPDPAPRLRTDLTPEARAEAAAGALRGMGLLRGHAPTLLILGHGASVANDPHESGYQCGACGGRTGEVSARVLAALLNDPAVRAHLPAHGIDLPADTRVVAGLHDTTTDDVTLYDTGGDDLSELRAWLAAAGRATRAERAMRLPGATPATVAARAADWAQVRPELGLAGCAAFVAAPRAVTRGRDLGGRAFLHSYDWREDDGFATLELILTAPVVVASWIGLQYYGSAVAPAVFGGGSKLVHNAVGGIGVVEGNGGRLRAGLPWQAVHDGEHLVHEPLRLTVMVEAPEAEIARILDRHPDLRALFDNGWLHLLVLRDGRVHARYRPAGAEDGAPDGAGTTEGAFRRAA